MNIRPIKQRKRLFLLVGFAVSCITYINVSPPVFAIKAYYYFNPQKDASCHYVRAPSLPDISDENPRKEKSIFFHETSCRSFLNGKITMTSRQACAVESAARINPNFDVYLLFASPGEFRFENTESDRMIRELMRYANVKIVHVDMDRYVRGTPVEELWMSESVRYSRYAQSHTSDVLRYLTLWKYGGIYLDLDVIVVKTLEDIPSNYAGLESESNVAAGIINFDFNGIGHKFANACLYDLKKNFNGNEWGTNGPGVITRLLKKLCGVRYAKDMLNKDCQGFTVYPKDKFYAVPWEEWYMYFEEKYLAQVRRLHENSTIVHVWGKNSADLKIPLDSQAPYIGYAKTYCPKVVGQCDEYF